MTTANWNNRTLFHGDNLNFLRAMNSDSVDLIATDPPFKKGRDFHATPDSLAADAKFQDRWSWERDVHQEWVDKITDDFPKVINVINGSRSSYGDDMGAFLCFMSVRLLEMHRVLKSTGSIYLHCDHTASHYLKELMDAVFGRKKFRNEIVWVYNTGGIGKRWFSRKHDVLLFYTKSDNYTFNIHKEKSYTPTLPEPHTPSGRRLGVARDPLCDLCEKGNPGQKYRMVNMRDVWTDINALYRNNKERYGSPTQKPLKLYQRIITASSNEGDIVLDPFCGCATTLVAAEKKKRNWVGIDIWDGAYNAVITRLEDESLSMKGDIRRIMFSDDDFYFRTDLPQRTDDSGEAVPFLRAKERVKEPNGKKMSRAEMYQFLLDQNGPKCQGCDRIFDDTRYLKLDHNTPRADGGINHISNRVLLCGPCNKAKSNIYTLSGLRRINKKHEWMAN